MDKPSVGASTSNTSAARTAIGLILLATTLFSCLDATAKYLVLNSGMPVGQITWIRLVAQFLGMLCIIPALGIMNARAMFQTSAPNLQWIRSISLALTTMFNFLALQYLRLDQTITILFLAPLIVALLAGPFLGEWVGWRRLTSVIIGFAGILIVVRPGLVAFNIGTIFSFAATLALAVFILLTRKLAGRDPAIITLFYSMFAGVVIGAPYTWLYGTWPSDPLTWALLPAMGIFGGIGHYLFIRAYNLMPASYLSPFLYLQIIAMVTLGYFVFGDLPDIYTAIGSLVVVGSGLYLYHREHVTRLEDSK